MMPEILVNTTIKLVYVFIPEVLVWLLFKKEDNTFRLRLNRAGRHGRLETYAYTKTWVVAIIIFLITLFSQDIFESFMEQKLHEWLEGFGNGLIFLITSLIGFDFLIIYNYLLEKKLDKISWLFIAILIVSSVLFYRFSIIQV